MTSIQPLRILITGPCAPPYGGVSVYIRRLFDYLSQRGHYCHVYDQFNYQEQRASSNERPEGIELLNGKLHTCWRVLTGGNFDIMHINERSWKHLCMMVTLARLKGMRPVITLHSLRDDLRAMGWLNRISAGRAINKADYIISSGRKELEILQAHYPIHNIRVITPFIPPSAAGPYDELPLEIQNFCQGHSRTICANGSNQDFYQGNDIYGLDMLVEVSRALWDKWNAGIIFCISRVTDAGYVRSIQERIRQLGMEKHFLIYCNNIEFWKVIRQCDIFVRPTRTDSFGISVAESLWLQKPAVASDACLRPAGTILFPAGDTDGMLAVLNNLLEQMRDGSYRFGAESPEDGSIIIENLYYEIIQGTR